MFRVTKPSVKRAVPDDQTPRKRRKLIHSPQLIPAASPSTPKKKLVRNDTEILTPVKVTDVKKALPTPPESVVGDDDNRQEEVAVPLDEPSVPSVLVPVAEKTTTAAENNQASPLTEHDGDAASSDGYETAVGDDEDSPVGSKEEKTAAKASLVVEKEEDAANSDATLWPPYEVRDEEFVAVRKERVIQADEDPLLDAALSLLS